MVLRGEGWLFMMEYILPCLTTIPLLGVLVLLFVPDTQSVRLHDVGFFTCLINFVVSIFL
jgi:hypothetical protein